MSLKNASNTTVEEYTLSTTDGAFSQQFSTSTDGDYTFVVTATDQAGNSASVSRAVTYDKTAPTNLVVSAPSGDGAYVGTLEVVGAVEDNYLDGVTVTMVLQDATGNAVDMDTAVAVQADGSFSKTFINEDGAYTVAVIATDAAGNSATTTRSLVLDQTPLTGLAMQEPAADGAYLQALHVSGTVNDNQLVAGLQVTLVLQSGGAPVEQHVVSTSDGTFSQDFAAGDGKYTLVATGKDAAGNSSTTSRTVTLDKTPPVVAITTPTEGAAVDALTVGGTVDDANLAAGITVDLKLQNKAGETVEEASFPLTSADFSQALTTAIDDRYTLAVTATDAVGNVGTTSRTFTFDHTPPTLALTSPESPTRETDVAVSGIAGDLTGVSLAAKVDDGAWVAVVGKADGSFTYVARDLSDGLHTIYMQATDAVGLATTESVAFTVETGPPTISVAEPRAGSTIASSVGQVTANVEDAVQANLSLDGGRLIDLTIAGGAISYPVTGLADGDHTVTLTATDPLGNVGTTSVSFAVDATAPTVAIGGPKEGVTVASSSVTVAGTVGDATEATLSLDDITAVDLTVDNGTVSYEVTGLADGSHTVQLTASDAWGNSANASVSFTVDTTAPRIEITQPAAEAGVASSSVTVTGSVGDAKEATLTVDEGTAIALTISEGNVSYEVADLVDGEHTVRLDAVDTLGNSASTTVTFTVDTTAPSVAITGPKEGDVVARSSVTVSGDVGDATNATFTVDGGTATELSIVDGQVSLAVIELADGSHILQLDAADAVGNVASTSVAFLVDTTPPNVAIAAPAEGDKIGNSTVTVTGSIGDAQKATLTVDGGTPTELTVADGNVSYAVTDLADGEHKVELLATDAVGNSAGASVVFTVDAAPPAIAITSPADGETQPSSTVTVTANVGDAVEAALTLDSSAAIDLTIADGDISYELTALAEGEHTVKLDAQDSLGNLASTSVSFTVDTVAPSVAIAGPKDGEAVANSTVTVTGTVGDAAEARLAVDGGTPVDLTITDGSLSHEVTNLADGSHTAVLTAVDAVGNSASASIGFTVDTTGPTVTITAPVDQSAFGGPDMPVIVRANVGDAAKATLQVDEGAATDLVVAEGQVETALSALEDGAHQAVLRAEDTLGNKTEAAVAFATDTTPPQLAEVYPADGATVTVTKASIFFSVPIDVDSLVLTVDNVAVPKSSYWMSEDQLVYAPDSVAEWLDGKDHTVEITLTDALGNAKTYTAKFTVENYREGFGFGRVWFE